MPTGMPSGTCARAAPTRDGPRSSRFRSRASSFPARPHGVGLQHRPERVSKARGGSLVRRAARHAVLSGVRGGRDHATSRTSRRASASTSGRSSRAAGCASGGEDDTDGKPGLDVFYNITPSLKLTATINTDFGETEVDARQINLSRFSVLFPEKRSFFLEGAGVFNFASIGPEPAGGIPPTGADVYPFFSRQIGLLGGEEVPIDAGVKLTGTVGRTDVGMLSVRTGDVPLVVEREELLRRPREAQPVAAVVCRRDLHRRQSGTRTVGPDLRRGSCGSRRRASWAGRATWCSTRYAVQSVNNGVSGRRLVVRLLRALIPTTSSTRSSSMREIQENFEPALGFVQRDNVRMFRVGGELQPAAEGLPEHPADVPRRLLHALHAAGQRRDRELGSLRHAARLAPEVGRQPARHVRLQPDLRTAVRAVRDLAGRVAAARRVPLHALPEQPAVHGDQAPAVGQRQPDVRRLLVGQGRAGDDRGHLQAAAAVHVHRQHQPDVRAPAGRPLHRAHLHVERQLRGVAAAVALEPDSVRQPLAQPGLAEPRALDAAARQRSVLRVQPGLDPGGRAAAAACASGPQDTKVSAKFQYSFRF